MAQRIYNKVKYLLRREKFDEKVALRELEIALKLVNEATNMYREVGGLWFFGRQWISTHRLSPQDRKSKLRQARELILDARKHDKKLLALGKELLGSLGKLPPRLKQQITVSQETELFVSESIEPRLKSIAQEVTAIELSIGDTSHEAYYFEGGYYSKDVGSSIKRVKATLELFIKRIKEIFSAHTEVAAALEGIKGY